MSPQIPCPTRKADISNAPQLPKEPHKLNLVDTKTKINAKPNNMGPPLATTEGRGASYHRYLATRMKVTHAQLPKQLKQGDAKTKTKNPSSTRTGPIWAASDLPGNDQ